MAVTSAVPVLVFALLFLGGSGGGAPLGGAPLPVDAGLQAAAPPECLFYASHHGLKAPDAASPNQFEQMLAEPENQAFLAELHRLAEQALKLVPPNDEPTKLLAATMPTLVQTLLAQPSMLYLADVVIPPQAPSASAGFVIRTGERTAAFRDAVEQWERFYLTQIPPNQAVETLTIEGVAVRRLPMPPQAPPVMWGVTGEYVFLTVGEDEASKLLKRLQQVGPAPEWLQALTKDVNIARPGDLLYFNFKRTFDLAEPLLKQAAAAGAPIDVDRLIDTLGVRQLRYLAVASGLSDEAAVSKLLIGREDDAQGILSLLGGKPLGKADLAGIPKAADFAMVTRLDGAAVFDHIVDAIRQIDARAFEQFTSELAKAEQQIGFSPRRDLLDGLGDLWAIYNSPTEGGSLLTGACVSVSVHDRAKLERVIEQLLRIAAAEANRPGKPVFALRKTTAGEQTITYLQFLREPIPVAPAWCLTDDRLVFALSPQMVRAHLLRPAAAGSLADVAEVAKQLATNDVTSLSYVDTTFGVQILYSYLQYGVTMGASALEKETGIQADLSKFPSFTAIGRHMRPSIGVVRNTPTAWSAESYATGPSVGPTAILGMGMALLLPQIQSARETARQIRPAITCGASVRRRSTMKSATASRFHEPSCRPTASRC